MSASVSVIMGSKSDLPVMQEAVDVLKELGVSVDVNIVSAHRTPELMFDFAKQAHLNGTKVIIAGAGGAAHLPPNNHRLAANLIRQPAQWHLQGCLGQTISTQR